MALSHSGGVNGVTTLSWSPPGEMGGVAVLYDVVSSLDPADFEFHVSAGCVESDDGADTVAEDTTTPASGAPIFYLVMAEHACGRGPAGDGTLSGPRSALDCP